MYETETGEVEDELPLYLFRQDKARVWGFEFEGAAPLAQVGGFQIGADVTADMTRAKIDSGPHVPRVPPLRLLGGIEENGERLDRSGETTTELQPTTHKPHYVCYFDKQKNTYKNTNQKHLRHNIP